MIFYIYKYKGCKDMKKSLLFVIAIVLLLTLVACGCQHDWLDATCVTPQSCSLCGEVQGEVLGHIAGDWKLYSTDMVDATVTSKKYCNVCGTEVDEQTV